MNDSAFSSSCERQLIRRAQREDKAALEQLILSYQSLIHALSSRFFVGSASALSREELIQAGYVGLMTAIKRYDFRADTSLGTYALNWILGEMRGTVRKALNATGGYEKIRAMTRVQTRFEITYGRSPSISELSQACGMTTGEAADLISLSNPQRYDACGEEGGENEQIPSQENDVDKLELKLALDSLNPEERQLILLRYFRDQTQAETAGAMGKSQAQISRIEHRAIDHLKAMLS